MARGRRVCDARHGRTGKLPSGAVGPDAIEGLAAFARGDDAVAIRWLDPHLDDLVRIDGSRAQQRAWARRVAYMPCPIAPCTVHRTRWE